MNDKYIGKALLIIAAFAICIISTYFVYFFAYLDDPTKELMGNWGAFGDFIGGLMNPIVAGGGLIMLLMTLKQNEKALKQVEDSLLQAEAMIEQGNKVIVQNAEELKSSREELRESRIAQQKLAEIEAENLKCNNLERKLRHLTLIEEVMDKEWADFAKMELIIDRHHQVAFSVNRLLIENKSNGDLNLGLTNHDAQHIASPLAAMLDHAIEYCRVFKALDDVASGLEIPLSNSSRNEVFQFKENLKALIFVKGSDSRGYIYAYEFDGKRSINLI